MSTSFQAPFEAKICARAQIRHRLAHLPRPLVFTNGVFDILHRGHATYLAQARTMGASLVVGVNSDASVKRLGKGDDRPINSQDDRVALLAALEAVNLVVIFDEDTPLRLIELIRPNVLVKGGDWDMSKLKESAVVQAYGGRVQAIAFEHQRSHHQLVRKSARSPLMNTQHAPLIEVTRGSAVECVHYGSVAVVDAQGNLKYQAGDPHFLTFTRSTLKPFQSAPFLRAHHHERFGFGLQEIALLCASHSGETMHTQLAERMLQKVGAAEPQLRCGCHAPMQYSAFNLPTPTDLAVTQLHNNCSGKHIGFLGYCLAQGLPLENYLAPTHALQQHVRSAVAHFSGVPEIDLTSGTDGCSAPNYALPLARVAHLYAQLAQGKSDATFGDALPICFQAMTAHPELVSGTGRNDLAFMQTAPGDWVAKIGADGVQVIGVKSAGLGIAIKVADGNMRALYTTAVSVLQQLGLVIDARNSPLAPWVRPQLNNFMGLPTGEVRAVVKLQKA